MRWRGGRMSRNVIDARRSGGGGRRLAVGGGGSLALVLLVVGGLFLGVDLTPLLGGQGGTVAPAPQARGITAADEERARFAATVLAFTEDVWRDVYPAQTGRPYRDPELVMFTGAVGSACGGASAATGPFYCPADGRAYLDTDFFVALERRFGAPGDFAAAYVIAHEIAHHVQNLEGILGEVQQLQARSGPAEANALQVRVELQADCLAGVWAHHAERRQRILDPGDFEEALRAARAIGDDRLAEEAGRAVRPHTFTHGTSAQRSRWFAVGFEGGEMAACDTFGARTL
ncbi:hypothetical protein BCF33_0728 [Hasllibacter halocynthiae]|uniref:Metalloprotease n=1 Tax=Hasllibacter halocynthiae TaxID=595589 RepID=A0A2T0X889_9RHOB|nr:neutral zinc metallopeptidase [Hasllibacter halocynthiae]PRY95115.1 hypothetical protein BCF33_0728 [Hasllibacter halocynthiae]